MEGLELGGLMRDAAPESSGPSPAGAAQAHSGLQQAPGQRHSLRRRW